MNETRKVCVQDIAVSRFVEINANGNCCGFFDDACYEFYLLRLLHSLRYYQVQLHAYVLLPDRIWLLVTPRYEAAVVSILQAVHRAYDEYFNTRFRRKIKSWSPPIKQIPVSESHWVLVCQKLIEREPVQQGRVTHPGAWRWSSYSANAFGGKTGFLTRHGAFSAFIRKKCDPRGRYRAYIGVPFTQGYNDYLRNRIERNALLARPKRATRTGMPGVYPVTTASPAGWSGS